MRLELVDKRPRCVVWCCTEKCFKFRSCFGHDFVYSVVHGEFSVVARTEKTKCWAFAMIGVQDDGFLFGWVKRDVVACTPSVDELLAVVKFIENVYVGSCCVELLEN